MTTPQPGDQRFTGHRSDDDAAMETCTVQLPLSVRRLFGRNPLVRAGDRIEALVLVLAVVVSLLAAPIAAAIGTAVHDSRSSRHAEQAETRGMVTATAIDDSVALHPQSKTMTARARWFAAGSEHIGVVNTKQALKPGDSIDIWVNQEGAQVGPPTRTAVEEAAAAALAIWLAVTIAAAVFVAGTRAVLNRARQARWERDFHKLLGDGDGHAGRS